MLWLAGSGAHGMTRPTTWRSGVDFRFQNGGTQWTEGAKEKLRWTTWTAWTSGIVLGFLGLALLCAAMADPQFMRLAIGLARRGFGMTSPNPMVGAVLVKGGKIIGRGWHRRAGLPHAEIEALRDA